jgi:hypothetical protein
MHVTRWLVAVILVVGLAACGGSHHHRAPARLPGSLPSRTTAPSTLALVLPASTAGPTTCTVYESGFGTQVIFESSSLNVSGECQAWTSREPGAGYLWTYQPLDAAFGTTAVRACGLRDPSGRVTATVVEDTGFAPVSTVERREIAAACTGLAGAGWIRLMRTAG